MSGRGPGIDEEVVGDEEEQLDAGREERTLNQEKQTGTVDSKNPKQLIFFNVMKSNIYLSRSLSGPCFYSLTHLQ